MARTTIYLIRHAHADWRQDESRPLSEAGISAAALVADRLAIETDRGGRHAPPGDQSRRWNYWRGASAFVLRRCRTCASCVGKRVQYMSARNVSSDPDEAIGPPVPPSIARTSPNLAVTRAHGDQRDSHEKCQRNE